MPTTVHELDVQASATCIPGAPPTIAPVRATRPTVPDALLDVALVDARQIAAAACISLTTWYDLVQSGDAPAPAFRGNRLTRWRLADVRAWLVKYANSTSDAGPDADVHPVIEKARRARKATRTESTKPVDAGA